MIANAVCDTEDDQGPTGDHLISNNPRDNSTVCILSIRTNLNIQIV